MTIEAVRIIGFAALFALVYAILYRPVLRMLESEKRKEESDITPDQESGAGGRRLWTPLGLPGTGTGSCSPWP